MFSSFPPLSLTFTFLDLRQALNDAEAFCVELRQKVKETQSELTQRESEISSLIEQGDNHRRQISAFELHQEKTSSALHRLKSEKESLEGLKESLESELEHSRLELRTLRLQGKTEASGVSKSFETEKLLLLLHSTLSSSSSSPSAVEVQKHLALISDSSATLEAKLEAATAALSGYRTVLREDHKRMAELTEKLDLIEVQSTESISLAESSQSKLKEALKVIADKEAEVERTLELLRKANIEKERVEGELSKSHLDLQKSVEVLKDERRKVGLFLSFFLLVFFQDFYYFQ